MIETLQYFHFLRPMWLIAIIPILILWRAVRPPSPKTTTEKSAIAPHLAAALHVGEAEQRRLVPIDGVAVCGLLLAIAVAGPTWSRVSNPLIAETTPLVVILKNSTSMETPDLAPTRLDRAKFKILDLIEARAGAPTALVTYAGTAHRVAPLTEDPNILRPLLSSLTPAVMPMSGSNATAAFELANDVLATSTTPGAVLFVLDDLSPSDMQALNAIDLSDRPPLVFLVAAPNRVELPQLGQVRQASVIRITPDDRDIAQIARRLRNVQIAALAADDRLQWDDRGWWLAWPIALLTALWFRKGWTMRWSAVILPLVLSQFPSTAQADGWIDWFLTPDQQGRIAFEDKQFAKAAELFQDPMWRGYAMYNAGKYPDAIEVLAYVESADAAFLRGLAQIKNRAYRPAVKSFETALIRQPDFPAAARNLEVATAILSYVERVREQSDTGEGSGIGADDIVFDNEEARGADTLIERSTEETTVPLTADQWIEAIDTDMGDFLRSRFLYDNVRAGQ